MKKMQENFRDPYQTIYRL